MDLAEAFSELKDLESSPKTMIIVAECSVRYSGRAESHLPEGERIIIIKSDRTLLVHQPTGNNPINYMKEGTTWKVSMDGGRLVMHASQLAQKEYLDITFHKVHSISSYRLEDGQKLQLSGSERDMAEMIYGNPSLIEKGFRPVSMEEQTKYGFIDVLGHDRDRRLVVVECKRYAADLKAVSQLRRYVERIRKSKGIEEVRGIIAAPKISQNAEKMLLDWGFTFVSVEPPNYLEEYGKSQSNLNDFGDG